MISGSALLSASFVLLAPPITGDDARGIALTLLEAHGVDSPVICEVHRIEAPLAGYLVDALGSLVIDGIGYSSFRIGIRDGSEQECGDFNAGDEFVFIGRGIDAQGAVSWLPAPGPDQTPDQGMEFDPSWEFLLDREQFETLEERHPPSAETVPSF